MTKYLLPLGIFIGGQIVALFCFLFLGAIGGAAEQLAADTEEIASAFWNWAWVSNPNVVKFTVFFFIELVTLYATARAFLKVK